jgi:hypothetical protein
VGERRIARELARSRMEMVEALQEDVRKGREKFFVAQEKH